MRDGIFTREILGPKWQHCSGYPGSCWRSRDTILQELVSAAVDLCGADSAGWRQEKDGSGQEFYHWIATAGQYSRILERRSATKSQRVRALSGAWAPAALHRLEEVFRHPRRGSTLLPDGILLPWKTEDSRGTIFVMAHGRTEAFDENDARLMTMLADFAAMGYRQQKQQARLIVQERAAAAAQMANRLAHEINELSPTKHDEQCIPPRGRYREGGPKDVGPRTLR